MLAAGQWDLKSTEMKIFLAPIKAFQGELALITHEKFNEQEIDNLQHEITPNVREIHAFWLARRSEHAPKTNFRHGAAGELQRLPVHADQRNARGRDHHYAVGWLLGRHRRADHRGRRTSGAQRNLYCHRQARAAGSVEACGPG